MRAEDRVAASRFELDVEERQAAIATEIGSVQVSLEFIASFFDIHPKVGREDYRDFVRPILERQPALQALGWNPRVQASERESVEAAAIAAGFPGFEFTERDSQGKMIRAGDRDEYVVVTYLEPYEGNEAASGFDVSSELRRREALSRSRDTGGLIASEAIRLVQEQEAELGILGFFPVYRDGAHPDTVERRRELIEGYVVGVFRIGDIVEAGLSGFRPIEIDVNLYDENAPPDARMLYAAGVGPEKSLLPEYTIGTTLLVGGRQWRFDFVPSESYMDTHRTRTPLAALAAGLVFTALVTSYMTIVRRRAARIAALIEEREQTEEALLESEERNRLTLESISDGGWDWNLGTGELRLSNSLVAAMRDSGEEGATWLFEHSVHPDDRREAQRALTAHLEGSTPLYEIEARLRGASGEYRWFLRRGKVVLRDADGRPLRMVGTDTDVTARREEDAKRRKLEAQVLHAQKLESLGVLTGGIAHDFNNLLTGILGNAELAHEKLMPVGGDSVELIRIQESAIRAAELVDQMLTYAGEGSVVNEPIDLRQQIEEISDLLHTSISKKAELRFAFDSDVPAVEGDPSQLRQVSMNLLINASEALGNEMGTVDVRISRVQVEHLPDGVLVGQRLDHGSYVCLEVADSGCGMDAETCARIFDPFFSTKFQGRGLGLAVVLGIVKSHGGAIHLTSSTTGGTSFKVFLPPSNRAVAPSPALATARAGLECRGSTVLVADDVEAIRRIAEHVLERAGFRVLTAIDGVQALEVFRQNVEEIDVVLLDLIMPRMGGYDAFLEMQRLRPEIPVILTSGYDQETSLEDLQGAAGFLKKPYRGINLIETLQTAIRSWTVGS